MTDPRLAGGLHAAIQRLPFGSAVIFRNYGQERQARYAEFCAVRRLCKRRGHMVFLAGSERDAMHWHADGYHSQIATRGQSKLFRSAPVHNNKEIARAGIIGADILFVSPIYKTRSHAGARPLGPTGFRRLCLCGRREHKGASHKPIIAVGGMTAALARMQDKRLVHGWAAIDAFIR